MTDREKEAERLAEKYAIERYPVSLTPSRLSISGPQDINNFWRLRCMEHFKSGYLAHPDQEAESYKSPLKHIPSKFSNSPIGSHHWAATLLSFVMRTGEFLSEEDSEASKKFLREWGIALKERATEVNNFLQSLPDIDGRPTHPDQEERIKHLENVNKILQYALRDIDLLGDQNTFATGSFEEMMSVIARNALDKEIEAESLLSKQKES